MAYVGLPLNRWDLRLAQPSGSQPGRKVPKDHCHPIHCARHDPARLHRPRTARARGVPGRVPRPDPRRLRTRPAPVHQLVPLPFPAPVRGPPRRYRRLRPRPGSPRPSPRHRHPAAVHYRRVLPVRRRRRAPRSFPGRARPPPAAGLRVSCHRPGPQRTRRHAGRRRHWLAAGARADFPARLERAASVGDYWRRYRASGPGARAPDPDDHPQGRRGRHHSARAAHRPDDRPGHRGTV